LPCFRGKKPTCGERPSEITEEPSMRIVAAPSLAVFKARFDGALSSLGWWKVSLLMAGGLEPDDLQGPFQLKPFDGSMIL